METATIVHKNKVIVCVLSLNGNSNNSSQK